MKPNRPNATLDELGRRLRDDSDFSATVTYFLDHVADREWLHARSRPSPLARLEAVINTCLGSLLGPGAHAQELLTLKCRGSDFFHGLVHAGPHSGVFFYFRGADRGLLTVPAGGPGGRTRFVRFTLLEAPVGAVPSPSGPRS